VTRQFETAPTTVPRARHSVMVDLIDAGVAIDTIETAALLATELAANAVQHSDAAEYTIDVDVDIDLRRVHVEVGDSDDRFPLRPLREPADADNGRGLLLVDSLSSRWGVRSNEPGKTVWFELPVD
jgi:serine/threonine-protein kinase RsbW